MHRLSSTPTDPQDIPRSGTHVPRCPPTHGEHTQPDQGSGSEEGLENREVNLKYSLVEGPRHVYADGSGMPIGEGEVSEPRFGASMYDKCMPQRGTKEEEDTSFVWNSGRQTVANREALSLSRLARWGTVGTRTRQPSMRRTRRRTRRWCVVASLRDSG